MSFYLGQNFTSFEELEKNLTAYCIQHNVQYWMRDTRKLDDQYKKRYSLINESLIYKSIKYTCIHGGRDFSRRPEWKGERIRQTMRIGCNSLIRLSISKDRQYLQVLELILDHNHLISKTLFKWYPGENHSTEDEQINHPVVKASFYVGQKFSSAREVKENILNYCRQQNVHYWLGNCKKIDDKCQKRYSNINKNLKYQLMHFVCNYSGLLKKKTRIFRGGKTMISLCKSFVRLRPSKDGKHLEVKLLNLEHNHITSMDTFKCQSQETQVENEHKNLPNLCYQQLYEEFKRKYLEKLKYDEITLPDPLDADFRLRFYKPHRLYICPNITFGDIYIFLVETEHVYTRSEFKYYKDLDCYEMALSGKIKDILAYKCERTEMCVLTCVIQSVNDLMPDCRAFAVIACNGVINNGHCTCMEGSAKICVHVAALLLSLETTGKKFMLYENFGISYFQKNQSMAVTETFERKYPYSDETKSQNNSVLPLTNLPEYKKRLKAIKKIVPNAPLFTLLSDSCLSSDEEDIS